MVSEVRGSCNLVVEPKNQEQTQSIRLGTKMKGDERKTYGDIAANGQKSCKLTIDILIND